MEDCIVRPEPEFERFRTCDTAQENDPGHQQGFVTAAYRAALTSSQAGAHVSASKDLFLHIADPRIILKHMHAIFSQPRFFSLGEGTSMP